MIKKRGKGGLGQYLLRGFKSPKKGQGKSRSEPKPRLRFSKKGKPRRLNLSRMKGEAKPKRVAKKVVPAASEPVAVAPPQAAETSVAVTTPTPEVVVVPPVVPGSGSLSTQDILKPDDVLRKSIEAFLMDQRSPHTRRAYGKDLKRFVLFLHGRKQLQGIESLTRSVLIAYKESLLGEGLEHTTVDRHVATLRSFFGWLVDDGIIQKSPADGVRFLNPKRLSTTRGFSDDEVRKVLVIPDLHTRTGSQHYAILMVLFYCGVRRSELCELRTRHIGVERNQHVFKLRGKGNKERLIVIIPPVWSAIRHYLMITGRPLTGDDYLFKPMRNNRTGVLKKALDPSMIFYIVTRYAKLAGIAARVSPHSCRATAISNARDHHVPDRAIQEFAGWASPDMITRYDKRKSAVEDSAAHSIDYGAQDRRVPQASPPPPQADLPAPSIESTEGKRPDPEPTAH